MKSIGTKFAFQIAIGLFAVIAVFGVRDISQRTSQNVEALHVKEDRSIQQLSTIMSGLMFNVEYDTTKNIVYSYLVDPDILSIKLFDGEQVVQHIGKNIATGEIIDLSQTPMPYANAETKQMNIIYNEKTIGAVEAVFSRHTIDVQVRAMIYSVVENLLLVIVVESAMVVWLIKKNITRPLHLVVHIFNQIANGNLNIRMPAVSSKNEIGQLLGTMKAMVSTLKQIVDNVKAASDHVASGSQGVNSRAQQMSQGSTEQAAAAQEASTSMEQMSANIRQNSENAFQTENIASKVSQDAMNGAQAVLDTVNAMRNIAKKISVIEDISRQTRMLSLNATIEAARAQEYGRGFSVVAAEVRSLSEQSQAAATEINQLMHSSMATAERAGDMLTKLVPDIRQTADLVREISAASREQDTGIGQINRAIQQLDQVTQENSAIAEEMEATAEQLASRAIDLQRTVAFFKIEETEREIPIN